MGHGKNAVGPRQGAPRKIESSGVHHGGHAGRRHEHVGQIVDRHHQARGYQGRRIEPRHVEEVHAALAQQKRQVYVRVERAGLGLVFEQLEIIGKRIELRDVRRLADQQVFRLAVGPGKLVDDVADVGAVVRNHRRAGYQSQHASALALSRAAPRLPASDGAISQRRV